jgi:hypothetical protein
MIPVMGGRPAVTSVLPPGKAAPGVEVPNCVRSPGPRLPGGGFSCLPLESFTPGGS